MADIANPSPKHWSNFKKFAPSRLREHFGDRGLRCDVDKIVAQMEGLTLREVPEPGWAGAVTRAENGEATIWVKAGEPSGRRRFTIAHELGHLLLHEGTQYRDAGFAGNSMVEREANEWAARLLMPEDSVRELAKIKLGTDDMATAFGVSKSAADVRVASLFYRRRI